MHRSPFHSLLVGVVGMLMILPYVPRPHLGDGHVMHEHCELCHLTYCTRDRCVCGHRHPNGTAGHFRRPLADAGHEHGASADGVQSGHGSGHDHHAATADGHDSASAHSDAPREADSDSADSRVSIEACGSSPSGIVVPALDKYVPVAPEPVLAADRDLDRVADGAALPAQLTSGGVFRPPIVI